MSSNYLEIIRPGINTTFQDKGRDHLYHIGIPFSGAMDNRNYLIANKLVNNNLDSAVIEFAYQGPHIKYSGEKINCAITGDVIFSIKKNMRFKDALYGTFAFFSIHYSYGIGFIQGYLKRLKLFFSKIVLPFSSK